MCSQDGEKRSGTPEGPGRRAFLRTAGLVGAGAAAVGPLSAGTASAAVTRAARSPVDIGRWDPDPESPQFTLAVMPDTQFLYWGSQGSINPEPQEASFRYIIDNSGDESGNNIVFMAHLGDLTEDAAASSVPVRGRGVRHPGPAPGAPTACWPGNHDVSGDDTARPHAVPGHHGAAAVQELARRSPASDSTGYNTAHIFHGGGREWLLLALDWRTSAEGFAWANQFIKDHPKLPVILTTHEIVGLDLRRQRVPVPVRRPGERRRALQLRPAGLGRADQRQRPDLPDAQRPLLAAGAHHADRTPPATTSTCTSRTTRTATSAARR